MRNKIIDLGMHPFADTFINENQLNESEPVYPLECFLDDRSGLVSLGVDTNPIERYNLYDYSYTSSNSNYSRDYWNKYAITINKVLKLKTKSRILEIGSNDGYLLSKLKDFNHDVMGIDSSKIMCKIANNNGIKSICEVFDSDLSKRLKTSNKNFDVIVANNVFNHSNDPYDFSKAVKNLLNENGVFIFEVPYWYNTIKDERFDQIYHEHVSYFTVKSAKYVLEKSGMTIFKVELTDYHGGSIRVYSSINPTIIDESINDHIKKEETLGLYDQLFYKKYMDKIIKSRSKFLVELNKIILSKTPIVCVGAAAKGNTLLNFYGLDKTIIDYVTDSSTHKIGKFTPLTRIPILSDEEVFSNYDKVYAIILSWNISKILKKKLLKINSKIKFINF